MGSAWAGFRRICPAARFGWWLTALMLAGMAAPATAARAQSSTLQEGPLPAPAHVKQPADVDNQTILRMHAAGLSDDLLLQTIQLQPGHYGTSPDDLIALKQAGISDRVISAMQSHGTGLRQRSDAASPSASPQVLAGPSVSPSPLAPGIDELGAYYKDKNGEWQPLQTERVQLRSGGWIKSTLTNNIVKQDLNGWLDNRRSPLALSTGTQILLYMPSGTQPEEYDLLRFREHDKNREFRVKTGGVFHSQTGTDRDGIEFHATKLAPQMYVFTVPKDIESGEYGVLPPGAANQRGLTDGGKIFTFSIRN